MDLPVQPWKTQQKLITILAGVLLVLLLAGCAGSDSSGPEFPTGRFDCNECAGFMIQFAADGTYVVFMRGVEYFHGKYSIEGETFHTGDSYCRDEETMPASYRWSFDGQVLTFQIIKDGCPDRVRTLDKKPWGLLP